MLCIAVVRHGRFLSIIFVFCFLSSQNPLPAQRHDVAAMPTATVAAVAVVMPAPEMLVVVLVPSDATAVMVAAVTVGVTLEPPTEIASPAGVCDIG